MLLLNLKIYIENLSKWFRRPINLFNWKKEGKVVKNSKKSIISPSSTVIPPSSSFSGCTVKQNVKPSITVILKSEGRN